MSKIQELLNNNLQWSRRVTDENPSFFSDLAKQQNPDFLWIGCSDSRVAANTIVDVMPGEIFVHRNVANLAIHTDINCLSVIQYAVEVLSVEHIIVCGHYGCGGIKAAVDGKRHGLIDNWLRHIKDVASIHSATLDAIEDPAEKLNKLTELNVAEQVLNIGESTIVRDAWKRGQPIEIHGLVYGLYDGMLRDLEISVTGEDRLRHLRSDFLFSDKRA